MSPSISRDSGNQRCLVRSQAHASWSGLTEQRSRSLDVGYSMMSRSNRLPTARHVIDIYKELLRSLELLPVPTASTCLFPTKTSNTFQSSCPHARLVDFAILNPGGGWDTKNWAPENYALLHDKLRQETGLHSVLTWGPGRRAARGQGPGCLRRNPTRHFPNLAHSAHRSAEAGEALCWGRHRTAAFGSRMRNADRRDLWTHRPSAERTILSRGHCRFASGPLWPLLQTHLPHL